MAQAWGVVVVVYQGGDFYLGKLLRAAPDR